MTDQFDADAGFLRSAGSGRNHDALGVHRLDLSDGHFVVAANLNPGAQFAQVLDEVVSERIVVIEDEDHEFIVAVTRGSEARFQKFQGFQCGRKSSAARTDLSLETLKRCSLTGLPLIAMLTFDFRQVFETLQP